MSCFAESESCSYLWHRSPEGSLAPLASIAQQQQATEPLAPFSTTELQAFQLQPGKLGLTDVCPFKHVCNYWLSQYKLLLFCMHTVLHFSPKLE